MTGLLLALLAAYGVFLVYTAVAFGWKGVGLGPNVSGAARSRQRLDEWMTQAGLDEIRPVELVAVVGALFIVGAGAGYAVFGGVVAPVAMGVCASSFPLASARNRRAKRKAAAREAWPRMIEEMRVLTGSAGRSIPQALFDVGLNGPAELRPAFAAAQREWLLTTDFPRTISVLKQRLVDATADAACETLLVANEIGGTDLDKRLAALVEDRIQDLQGRKDAESKQAGVRFARRFVLLVPLGMAVAGLSIGDGRQAYQTGAGQVGVLLGIGLMGLCWMWAGRIMKIPEEERVFYE